MKKLLPFVAVLLSVGALTGCDFLNKFTEKSVNFKEFKEKIEKINLEHKFKKAEATGYDSAHKDIKELYSFDEESEKWLADAGNDTVTALPFINSNVKEMTQSFDTTYTAEFIEKYFTFTVGMDVYKVNYKDTKGGDEGDFYFNKNGLVTKYYSKITYDEKVNTTDLKITYSK